MKFILTKNKDELSEVMSQLMLAHMHTSEKRTNIAITTGSTCIDGYQILAKQVKNKSYFDHIHYYIFDEFWFKSEDYKHEISVCQVSLDAKYFASANIKKDHIHDLTFENYKTFDEDIKKEGGLELVIMGIGKNGHFCGNQPGTFSSWKDGTRLVRCDETPYLIDYSRHLLHNDFHSKDENRMPEHYITMGPRTIMDAKNIIFILSGKEKAEVAKKAFIDPITKEFPVSIFQLHQHVTVIIDEDAASSIKEYII